MTPCVEGAGGLRRGGGMKARANTTVLGREIDWIEGWGGLGVEQVPCG